MSRFFSIILLVLCIQVNLKAQDATYFHNLGKNYLIDGDYASAESMLYNAYQLDTANITYIKDLSLCYYFEKEFTKALHIIKPITDSGKADDQCFQIAGNIYKGLRQYTACEELYKKGLLQYPNNGAINNEMGELLSLQNRNDCIDYGEKGIEKDPAYSRNYYNASKYYSLQQNYLWSLIYGEIYINIDPYGNKTAEVKDIVLNGYKKLYMSLLTDGDVKDKNKFVQKVLSNLSKQNATASQGISVNKLIMIRTGFILDWYNDKTEKFPFHLFEFHQQLLREGLFEAYNQWLFGSSENLSAFQSWTQLHNQEYAALTKFLKSNPYTVPEGQYYR